MKCNSKPYPFTTIAPSVHGLIWYGRPSKLMVYNPSMRRSITLPKNDSHRIDMYYLGYDPINGDYKVLSMTKGLHVGWRRGLACDLSVLTLGNGNSWRKLKIFLFTSSPESLDICIDGVLYYEAYLDTFPAVFNKYKACSHES
ncbi:F-box protein [Cardamine amara subsp. amara]|uniref:F-box protein n=1 Tax=Cardamine amara subsp. amara TaxID=228776 RepID=A0ABD1BQG1_CARAN